MLNKFSSLAHFECASRLCAQEHIQYNVGGGGVVLRRQLVSRVAMVGMVPALVVCVGKQQ